MRTFLLTLLLMIAGLIWYASTHLDEIQGRQEMKLQKIGELGDGSKYMGIIKLQHGN